MNSLVFDVIAFFVTLSIFFAAGMWVMVWTVKFPLPIWDIAKIFVVAFTIQGFIYLTFSFIIIDILIRVYLVRASIIVICLSQAIPLLITYRAWKHEQRTA